MKTLHRIDFPAQFTILSVALLASIFNPFFILMGFFIGLGIWQPAMALIFAFSSRPHAIKGRTQYEITLLTVSLLSIPWLPLYGLPWLPHLGGGIGEFLVMFKDYYLYAMLFIGLVMGIWNMTIAYKEFKLTKQEHAVWDIE